ncbi:group II intron maturase-specific domain-containing protein, partial [Massilia sp. LXY-6]|uniref:group II intron maturase-specific domain-containing protein n=1 Tax=Massilia sp. LXY-6 TaxID=3379823 RepID=UPI003EE16260
ASEKLVCFIGDAGKMGCIIVPVAPAAGGARRLNQRFPKISGWANYHQHIVANETFSKVDNEIWHALWRWALRRHPNKGRYWVKDRYFPKFGTRKWVFSCTVAQKNGKNKTLPLRKAGDVEIRRHVKIRGAATPFDPSFEEYFEERTSVKMKRTLKGRRKLLYLWRRQRGLCPCCGEKITTITGWHKHHLVRRVDGGSDSTSNLWLLHPACHMQGHASGFKFVLPVSLSEA